MTNEQKSSKTNWGYWNWLNNSETFREHVKSWAIQEIVSIVSSNSTRPAAKQLCRRHAAGTPAGCRNRVSAGRAGEIRTRDLLTPSREIKSGNGCAFGQLQSGHFCE